MEGISKSIFELVAGSHSQSAKDKDSNGGQENGASLKKRLERERRTANAKPITRPAELVDSSLATVAWATVVVAVAWASAVVVVVDAVPLVAVVVAVVLL